MSTIKFKRGDTVRRKWCGHLTVNVGDICVVKEANVNGFAGITLEGHSGSYDPENFEIVNRPLSLESCHDIVRHDIEISLMQSDLYDMRKEHKRKEAELEEKIKDATVKLDALKAEYNIV